MRLDLANQLSALQAFTGGATVSTNSFQIANYNGSKPDISIGRRYSILGLVTTAAGAGSTHTMDAIQADDAALTSNVGVLATRSFLAAALTLGQAFDVPIPQKTISKLFIGFRNTATGGTTTVTLDVYLLPSDEIPAFRTFAKVVDAAV